MLNNNSIVLGKKVPKKHCVCTKDELNETIVDSISKWNTFILGQARKNTSTAHLLFALFLLQLKETDAGDVTFQFDEWQKYVLLGRENGFQPKGLTDVVVRNAVDCGIIEKQRRRRKDAKHLKNNPKDSTIERGPQFYVFHRFGLVMQE